MTADKTGSLVVEWERLARTGVGGNDDFQPLNTRALCSLADSLIRISTQLGEMADIGADIRNVMQPGRWSA